MPCPLRRLSVFCMPLTYASIDTFRWSPSVRIYASQITAVHPQLSPRCVQWRGMCRSKTSGKPILTICPMRRATSSTRSVIITKSLVPRISWACCASCTLMALSSLTLELLGKEHTNCTPWAQNTVDPQVRPLRNSPLGLFIQRMGSWLNKQWYIPPKANADFVCAMEDTLEVYRRPYASSRPLVCIDETSKQQVKETREPLPSQPGKPQRYDYEYERNGVSNLFMIFAPLEGWRHVKVTDRRTNVDWAHCLKDLVDVHFPHAEQIVLMSDNLNTHKPAALYEAFAPQEARRIIEKIEWHHTPKHGSWLDMAEIELSVLQRQCLDRRIPDQETLKREVAAWEHQRNQHAVKANWRFTTEDARIKLKKLYPSF